MTISQITNDRLTDWQNEKFDKFDKVDTGQMETSRCSKITPNRLNTNAWQHKDMMTK